MTAQVVVLGAGAIGRELILQIAGGKRTNTRLSVCGVVDRSGFVFAPDGLTAQDARALCSHKAGGRTIATARGGEAALPWASVERLTRETLRHPIVVDATASDTRELLQTALSRGFDAVLANKVPISLPQREVDELFQVARTHHRQILHEATVGAGLPVIDTLRKLLDAGDRVFSIEGCPSGTLGFLFTELQRGRSFANALSDAMAAGYTEPDPRVDLSGLDVARKALILGRGIGFRGDLGDVEVESLVPEALREVPLAEFLERADELDVPLRPRLDAAAARGGILRYRARVTRRAISVRSVEVVASDPLASLRGTDNQFTFTTERYCEQPLVISGPGAGATVTASGIHNDLLRLVASLPHLAAV